MSETRSVEEIRLEKERLETKKASLMDEVKLLDEKIKLLKWTMGEGEGSETPQPKRIYKPRAKEEKPEPEVVVPTD